MPNFWKIVNRIIKEADLLLIVLDARNYQQSINKEIEQKINNKNKKFIYVLNKIDLLTEKEQQALDLKNSIKISAAKHINNMALLRRLSQESNNSKLIVGVIGYPNTGKSSLINSLKGRKSARVSSISGFTTGIQKIRITKNILLLDSPGVFPKKEQDDNKHALIGAKDINKIKDPDLIAMKIIEENRKLFSKYYQLKIKEDLEETLEELAKKKSLLLKGGVPDVERAARAIISDYQKGKWSKKKKKP